MYLIKIVFLCISCCYVLIKKKNWTPVKCIALFLVIGIVGAAFGIWVEHAVHTRGVEGSNPPLAIIDVADCSIYFFYLSAKRTWNVRFATCS